MAVLLCEPRTYRAYTQQFILEQAQSVAHLKHQRGVDSILTRGSPVHELSCLIPNTFGEHVYQGNGRSTRRGSLTIQRRNIEQLFPATGSNEGRNLLRDDTGASFR